MRVLMIFFYILLVLFGVTFAVLNATSVKVNLYFATLTMPISLLMTIMLGVGLILGMILFIFKYWRLKSEQHKLRNQLKLSEKEIKNLRAIPLKDQH